MGGTLLETSLQTSRNRTTLSSTYHPQTDGSTERWNQEVWAYLRAYVGYMQKDWARWLFFAQVALNNRPSSSTGLSPFFIIHGFHPTPIEIVQTSHSPHPEEKRAEAYLARLQEIQEFSQCAMTAAQQQQEFHANSKRSASESYRIVDRVWLSYEHYESNRPKRWTGYKESIQYQRF